uniref:ribonuclease 4-like n=1 Tax=Jaculus jaculus TaxID=51337 RepID=UPI00033331DB|nr:ribonuclease 4-like [Jaculus jaculus]XP_045012664.1 ribonuclease 4-like [Jaculus jaculus]XP_045012665.1 ribonuclease 4-like [Jaculus jaculus]XP_045012666.1 ribonuclease 4-like [Jaculus jaculus]XP_045012667.1 ribonuclease 4-like [Jaculus jaculus]XP_045012668.1 ribonuclease 4-like [Jaculus jaculus]
MMVLQKIHSLILVSLLTMLGLGLVQLSYGQNAMYQRFLRQHVDPSNRGGTNSYCDSTMRSRGMTTSTCKNVNTFIHESIQKIKNICNTPKVRCKNGRMNCHRGQARVTDCNKTGGSPPNCRYRARGSTRRIVIACSGNPKVPVHFDK